MPSFYNPINYILKKLINNSFDNRFDNNFNNELNYYIYPNNNPNYNNPINRRLNIPNYNNRDVKISYDNRYNSEFYMDEKLNYKDAKFQTTKDLLSKKNPNISDIEINKYLDIEWKNLSDSEKSIWKKYT